MAETEEPSRAPPAEAMDMGRAVGVARPWLEGCGLFLAALVACFLGYLAATVPGRWFGGEPSRTWGAPQLSLTRGSGVRDGDDLVVTGIDGSGTAVASVETDFRSSDFRAIAWDAIDVPEQANLRVLWRTDYAPGKLNSAPVFVASGRLLPTVLARDPNWIGRIRGLALLVRGPLPAPLRVRGVTAKSMSARDVAGDRVHEWFRFEAFTGTSVDSVTGGDDVQQLPLAALLAVSALVAAISAFGVVRSMNRMAALPAMLAAVFIAAWLVDDVRWFADLARQARATALRYAGLDWREKHLAAEDGALFGFAERVRAKLPPAPARVFVVGDTPYFRARAAYHLYPHNVLYEPLANAMPDSAQMRPGDFLVVYQRRGVQYDPGAGRLRWDGGAPIPAELVLAETGSALFRLR